MFGTATTGASNDIEKATNLARSMVTTYGMSDRFGMVQLERQGGSQYLGGETSPACSPEAATRIDVDVVEIVKAAKSKADLILRNNEQKLREIAAFLFERESITGEEFMAVLNAK